MATSEFLPRFFKVFISHFSSEAMMIPIAYYNQLPSLLPKTAILQGFCGSSWNVAVKIKDEDVYFEQGWSKFVADSAISDGDFLTFVYNGDHIFDVSVFRLDGDKETTEVSEVDQDKDNSVISLSSEDDADVTCSKSAMKNPIPQSRDKGKLKVVELEDSDDEEDDGVYSSSNEETDTDSCSEFKMTKTTPQSRNKNKGKKKKKVVESSDEESDNDSDSDYNEDEADDDDPLDLVEKSNSDTLYAPDNEDTATSVVKPKVAANLKRKEAAKLRKKVDPLIKNPEQYLDNPKNIHFETNVKNRLYELLVHAQLVKDYCLTFGDYIDYIDRFGKLRAKTAKWKDQRVCVKKWMRICTRNKLKKEDRVLCELLRKQKFVYAIKLHIIRGKNL